MFQLRSDKEWRNIDLIKTVLVIRKYFVWKVSDNIYI